MEPIVLKGRDLYAAVDFVFNEARPYSDKSARAGESYHTGQLNGKYGFTCSPEFYKAFKAGLVMQATFSYGKYQPMAADGTKRKDPITGAEMPERESATLGKWFTLEQLKAQYAGEKQLIMAEAELTATTKVANKFAERAAYRELGVPDEEIKDLMALVG